jgi:hypothetical protein
MKTAEPPAEPAPAPSAKKKAAEQAPETEPRAAEGSAVETPPAKKAPAAKAAPAAEKPAGSGKRKPFCNLSQEPTPFWKGYLNLSLVTCPVALTPTTSDARPTRSREQPAIPLAKNIRVRAPRLQGSNHSGAK